MTCLTLFAGAGGADLGLSRAGFRHLACVEGDATACATLRAAGFPAAHAWIGGPGPDGQPAYEPPDEPVDLLWASPPCQPYSMAGKRQGADDARDGWPATLAMIGRARPRWVIVENVVGAPVEGWAEAVRALGYVVSHRVLDAVDWGLPSHRRRVFLVGGPVAYEWPRPTHSESGLFLPRWVGFGDALGLTGDSRHLARPSVAVAATEVKGTNYRANGGPQSPMRASDSLHVATGRRRLTVDECRILLGFPESYPFQGTTEARYRQIGNAVAPVMGEVLGEGVKNSARILCV